MHPCKHRLQGELKKNIHTNFISSALRLCLQQLQGVFDCLFIGILITFRANTLCGGFQEFDSYNGIEDTCTEDTYKIRKSTAVYIGQLGSQCRQECWVACQSPESMLRTQKHKNLLLDRKAGPVSMVRSLAIT